MKEWVGLYLRVELINLLNGRLDIPSVDSVADVHSVLNSVGVTRWSDIGLLCKLLRRGWISFVDQVVHDHKVDVTTSVCQPNVLLPQLRGCLDNSVDKDEIGCGSEVQVIFLLIVIQRDSQLE